MKRFALRSLRSLRFLLSRTSGGQPTSETPPPARLKKPELAADTLRYAGRSFLRGLTPQKMVGIFDSADRYIADQIELAAQIEESDDHINGTLDLRRQAVLRLDTLIEPGDPDDERSVAAAEAVQEIIEAPWFYDAREWLLRATLQQWTAVELLYEQGSGFGVQGAARPNRQSSIVNRQSLWLPVGFRAVEPERWYFDRVDDEGDPVPLFMRSIGNHSDLVEPLAGKFVIHSVAAVPGQPGRHAKVRAIAKLWFLGRLALTEWGGLIDSWFQPFTHITYQKGLGEKEIQTMVDSFLDLASRKVAATPEGTNITLHDVPDQTPHENFQDFVRRAESVMLLGQESSQMVREGQETGATLQGSVRDDIRDADARLLDSSLNESLFDPWCTWNYGPDVAPPRIKHVIHESIDPTQRGQVFEVAQRIGLRLVAEQVYSDLNIEMPLDTPEVLEPPATPPGAPTYPQYQFSRSQSSAVIGARGGGPIAALAAVFEGHAKAARRLAEGASSAEEFAAGLDKLADSFDTDALAEAIHQATFAHYASGRLALSDKVKRGEGNRVTREQSNKVTRSSRGDFVTLSPCYFVTIAAAEGGAGSVLRAAFEAAVKMLRERHAVTAEQLAELQGLNKARAFSVARVADQQVVADLRDGLARVQGEGATYRDFVDSINGIMEQRGWTGLRPSHAKLIYEQNTNMAYTAGRYDQATDAGVQYWRYLPSDSVNPRPEHRQYYGKIYRMGEGPMPPLDFGCKCNWEVVFDEEIDAADVEDAPPSTAGQEFRFSPADYFKAVTR